MCGLCVHVLGGAGVSHSCVYVCTGGNGLYHINSPAPVCANLLWSLTAQDGHRAVFMNQRL